MGNNTLLKTKEPALNIKNKAGAIQNKTTQNKLKTANHLKD